MTQQVNLYQPILRTQKRVFSSGTIGLIVAGVAALMLLLWGFNRWQLALQHDRLSEIQQRESATASDVARLTRELNSQVVSTRLRDEVEQLRAEKVLKEQLYRMAYRSDDSSDQAFSAGFARALEAFGRRRVDDLWLTRIVLADSGRNVVLEGRTANAAQVPQLVDHLGRETSLGHMSFRTIRVLQEDEPPLSFVLSTDVLKDEESR